MVEHIRELVISYLTDLDDMGGIVFHHIVTSCERQHAVEWIDAIYEVDRGIEKTSVHQKLRVCPKG